jgi:hypothetical protein
MKTLLLFAACVGWAWAADERIESPVIGHIFDSKAGAIRSITGIPGSSQMTDALPFDGTQFHNVWIAPGRNYGLAARADGKLYRIDVPARSVTEIGATAPEHVWWSPSGTSAALQYSSGEVRVILHLETKSETGLQVLLTGDATDVAISDDGSVLLAIIARENARTLIAFTAGGVQRSLLTGLGLKNALFFFGSRKAVVSDDAEGKIFMLRESGDLSLLADVDEASALAIAQDNSRVFVASRQRRNITTINISDGSRAVDDCLCVPGVLNRLQADVFGVTVNSNGPLWLFNAAAPGRRFTFVPQPEGSRE